MKYQSAVKLLFKKLPDNLVFLDIETTGLDPEKGANIVEIAMLKVCGGIEERYESLVNPGLPIPSECSKVHAIYDDMIKNSPSFDEIAGNVFSFIGHSVVVCHNAPFDLLFVCRELYLAGVPVKNIRYIDTLKLARQYFSFDSNKLGNIADAIGIEAELRHRAMADVLTMFSVAKYIFANMYRKDINMIEPSVYKYNPD
ncbi:3'-5' exonuclease [Candidatus Endomicrobiellum trichonymphae]|uniref:3'-5' exonuclease n=1 Tax=Endomicrobium trichonymphae TaxID=1408204 RepID=UPI000865E6A0|nr:3'-5' exonuclease [Candidatus Endomicrobium trichonymphae]BAV59253.1 DNA polymerase III subunit epsilon [Candidatus Endomicrobium trichonymphae]